MRNTEQQQWTACEPGRAASTLSRTNVAIGSNRHTPSRSLVQSYDTQGNLTGTEMQVPKTQTDGAGLTVDQRLRRLLITVPNRVWTHSE